MRHYHCDSCLAKNKELNQVQALLLLVDSLILVTSTRNALLPHILLALYSWECMLFFLFCSFLSWIFFSAGCTVCLWSYFGKVSRSTMNRITQGICSQHSPEFQVMSLSVLHDCFHSCLPFSINKALGEGFNFLLTYPEKHCLLNSELPYNRAHLDWRDLFYCWGYAKGRRPARLSNGT